MKRRTVILGSAAAGASVAAGLALDSVLNPPSGTNPAERTLQIDRIVVVNDHHEPHELGLTVRYDGEKVLDEHAKLGTAQADQSAAFDSLPAGAGEYRLKASLEDGQTSQLSPEYYPEYSCAESAVVMVNSDGNLSPFFTEPCQTDSSQ